MKKYAGEYKNGKPNGQGTFTYASGRVNEGIFKDNKFQYARKGTPTVITRKSPRPTPRRSSDPDRVVSA